MIDAAKLLKRLINTVNGHVIESYLVMDGVTVAAGGYASDTTATFNKAGYYLIGIVGFNLRMARIIPYRLILRDMASWQCESQWAVYNVGTSSSSICQLYANVLWLKFNKEDKKCIT